MLIVSFHVAASKQKRVTELPFVTGGNWKKSPVAMICIPPKGFVGDFRII
jgi:hypothetical protein